MALLPGVSVLHSMLFQRQNRHLPLLITHLMILIYYVVMYNIHGKLVHMTL
jgi:hypothetical protein